MTYRVTYEGSIEGDYETEDEAVQAFFECLVEDIGDGRLNIGIEKFNEETEKWE